MAFCKCGFDHFLFLLEQCTIKRRSWASDLGRLTLDPGFVHRKSISFAQDDGPLNYILQLTNVARPAVRLEQFESLSIDCSELLSSLFSEAVNEVLDKQGNVRSAIAQRRHLNRHDIQS